MNTGMNIRDSYTRECPRGRYILTGAAADVSDAIQKLFNEDLDPRLDAATLQVTWHARERMGGRV